MPQTNPEVSIIMATYNRSHLIKETLDSIENQSFKNWECIIVDDGCTDDTHQILQSYLERDSRFHLHKRSTNHKKGLPGSRNHGIELVRGNYIIFFDDDDIVHPENLKICLKFLANKELSFCRYDKQSFTDNLLAKDLEDQSEFRSSPVDINDIEKMITGKLPFASCTVMWKKECFDDHRFDEELLYAEEWEFYSRILSLGISGTSINKVLYFNRKHPYSNTGEFYNNNRVRRDSYAKAIKLVITNLFSKGLLTENLVIYFIRLSFFLNNLSVLNFILKHSHLNKYKIYKYKLGFTFYPLIRPIFILKSKLMKT